MGDPVIAVHGGAHGRRPEDDRPHREVLCDALMAAAAALDHGGDAVDAACRAVAVLEDAPVFNAGRGSVLHRDGAVEMDAAVMQGEARRAGAVATVTRVRHPILLAREVMERTPHVLITGAGAERLAEEWGLELRDPEWFVTERQRERWLARAGPGADADTGTVGAVVLDADGRLAAATSTGGIRDQLPGRVGDSPLVGAGVYAEDGVCAVSATGDGEHLIRALAAHEVAALVRHREMPVEQATETVLRDRVAPLGGEGGLIALDAAGNVAMPFTTAVMFRGCVVGGGTPRTAVGPEPLR
jgi:beta-aspartyl-peptidase (threonine type)